MSKKILFEPKKQSLEDLKKIEQESAIIKKKILSIDILSFGYWGVNKIMPEEVSKNELFGIAFYSTFTWFISLIIVTKLKENKEKRSLIGFLSL